MTAGEQETGAQEAAAQAAADEGRTLISFNGKVALLMATALALLGTPLVSPAMKDIAIAFADQTQTDPVGRAIMGLIGWFSDTADIKFLIKFILLSIPALFIVVGAPLAGWLSDILGRRKLLIASLLLFAVAGTSGYFVDTLTGLFIGRAFLGIGIAGIKTLSVAMVGDYFTGAERARFIGWQGAAMKLGGVVFLLLGGFLADIHWSIPFWGYMLAFVALPGVLFSLYESAPQKTAVAAGDTAAPLPPLPLLRVAYILFAAFVASVLFFITLVQIPFFIPERFGGTPGQIGVATALANLSAAIVAMQFYRFKARLSYVAIFAYVFFMIGLGYAVVAIAPSYEVLLAGMVIAGCGFSQIVPAQSAWMIATVPAARRGLGIGLVTTAMFLGQFASPIAIQPFVDEADPARVFVVASAALFVLFIVYAGRAFMARKSVATEAG